MTPEAARLKIRRLRPGAAIPERATTGSAGLDLSACAAGPITVPARGRAKVGTGLAAEIPPGAVGLVFGRSGLGINHGVAPANAVGVIDSDYRGEIVVGLMNSSDKDYIITPGERIAQLVLVPVLLTEVEETVELAQSERGAGGFGSTGK